MLTDGLGPLSRYLILTPTSYQDLEKRYNGLSGRSAGPRPVLTGLVLMFSAFEALKTCTHGLCGRARTQTFLGEDWPLRRWGADTLCGGAGGGSLLVSGF